MQQTLIALLNNAALLLILSVVFSITNFIKKPLIKQIISGILIASTGIAVMSVSFELSPGIFFDTRSILISLTALLFGLIPTIFTVVAACIFRIVQGGAGTLMGVVVILSSAIIGLIWRYWVQKRTTKYQWINVYLMSLLVHAVMLVSMALLPYPNNINTIREISFPILLVYPVASMLLYWLLISQQQYLQLVNKLTQSEKRFRMLFDNNPLAYQSLDTDGNIIDVNQRWLDTFGLPREEVIGRWFGDFILPAHKEDFKEKFLKLENAEQIHSRLEIQDNNGKRLLIDVDGNIVTEHGEENKQILCILKDITQQEQAEIDLLNSEKKYRQLYETMAQGVVYQSADGRIISANPEAERILGLTLEQMLGLTSVDDVWGTIHEDGSECPGEDHPSMIALRTGKPFGPAILGINQPKLNDTIWILINAIPVFENGETTPSMVYTTFQDITAERKANQEYQLLFNQMVDAFALHEIICDGQGKPIDYRFLAINTAFEKMVGLEAKDIIGKTVLEVFPETEAYWIDTYGKVALAGEPVSFNNYSSATDKYFRVKAYRPAPKQFACTFSDDTTQIRAEQALKESEQRYSSYIENAPYAVFVSDEKGQCLEVNSAATKMTGYSREQLLNMTLKDIIVEEFFEQTMQHYALIVEQGSLSVEVQYKHKNGSARWWMIKAVKITNNRYLGFAIDTTAKKQAEEDLLFQSQRDYLTGLYNRRFYETELKRLDSENQLPLSIITGDINGLKLVNDAFGHEEGDKLIIESARIIEKGCRKGDIFARVGGDEFGIIMPNTDSDTAYKVMNNILDLLKKFDSENNQEIHRHSVSLGYATKEKPEEDVGLLFKTAEEYMYQRKMLESKSFHSTIVSSIKATMFEKSHETEEHAERLVALSKKLGIALDLPQIELDKLELLATLHDIGKVGISDYILTKPEKLNKAEWVEMKRHPEIGYRIAMSSPELVPVAEGILSHHEWWDGNGYPKGLQGENIPLISRIITVVDAYDAMTNDRPYRKGLSSKEAIEIIKNSAGTQFDPTIAKMFVDMITASLD